MKAEEGIAITRDDWDAAVLTLSEKLLADGVAEPVLTVGLSAIELLHRDLFGARE